MMMRALPPVLVCALALSACGQPAGPEADPAVEASGAWCRPTPQGRDMTACYLTLVSTTDDRLTLVQSPRAAEMQMHSVTNEDGVARMFEMPDGLALPAGQAVALAPGGDHLMLIGATVPLGE